MKPKEIMRQDQVQGFRSKVIQDKVFKKGYIYNDAKNIDTFYIFLTLCVSHSILCEFTGDR